MWIFLLSFLVTKSAQSASIGYPYGSILTYSPQNSASVHGYLRYLDNYGARDLVGYNDPQSLYALRQIKHINSAVPTPETVATKSSKELTQARETYLRAASLQQYQHLKNNIDALKAEGKEPSTEKLSNLQTLGKIAFASDFSLVAELPEVKSTLHDLHLSMSGFREPVQHSLTQPTNIKQNTGEQKTYVSYTNLPTVAIEETSEQKHAREDHLRIYKEQIAHLKQLELEHQKYVNEANINTSQSPNIPKPIDEKIDNSKALTEWEQATQEHFRLWNEAKSRAEQAAYKHGDKGTQEKAADQQQISTKTIGQSVYSPKQTIQNSEQNAKSSISTLQANQQQSNLAIQAKEHPQIFEHQEVVESPEVVQAREEHLRIVNEHILKSQQAQAQQPLINSEEEKAKFSSQSFSLKESSPVANYRTEQSTIEDTPEVKKAREEHLRLVQEANQRAQYVEQQELKYKQGAQVPILKSQFEAQQSEQTHLPKNSVDVQTHGDNLRQQQLSETQVSGETSEVQRAREEHLRIFNSIKAHTEQEHTKQNSRTFPHPQSDQKTVLDFAIEEERLLELERLREAERLQKEHQQIELERLREAERLAEEKRQMDAELKQLRVEEEQRLATERLLEEKRLQQEQEELKTLPSGDYQEMITQSVLPGEQDQIVIIASTSPEQLYSQKNTEEAKQRNQQFSSNTFLKVGQVASEPTNRKTNPVEIPSNSVASLSDIDVHNGRYIQSSQQSGGSKHEYVKNDKVKHDYHDSAGYQPADTAIALIALEKATNDHFRAHELALEQLRLARIQNPTFKDCT